MINIVDYAQNGYLSSPYVVVNSVSFPDTLIDTLGSFTSIATAKYFYFGRVKRGKS